MNPKVAIRRLATGVPGLDEVLGGGLPEFSFNLIAGPAGCGKTTLAHQLMFALASRQRPALYLTLHGEPLLKMLRYQQQFSFFDTESVNHSVFFLDVADDTLEGNLDKVLARIVADVEKHGPAFLFVDSFRSAVLTAASSGNARGTLQHFIQRLGMLMTSWQATTFLIGEYAGDDDTHPVLTVADGLIWLHQSIQRNSMVRKMQIVKMRGQSTLSGLHTFRIDQAGLTIFAPVQPTHALPWEAPAAKRARVLMGVPLLDDMMGGGLPRGYSLLVAGPSGAGKSILAEAFLIEGARSGENGVIAVFEQHATRLRNAALETLIEEGRVELVESRATDLSINEVILLLIGAIRRLNATRVVIDSLSGFELALAPTFRDDFRESLARLVDALSAIGVSTLMISELEDRYTDLRFSPHGTAFLTDAIIVQRYVELDSRLRRVMAVAKVRGSPHSDELRLFSIDDAGIHIGVALSNHDGLLGGRSARQQGAQNSADGSTVATAIRGFSPSP